MYSSYSFLIVIIISGFTTPILGAGDTTCAGSMLDWYTGVVGETPCMTYQRLRQLCNDEYEVHSFRPDTPGDNCDDQVSDCCCNSVAWALSMLCFNCQRLGDGNNTSPNGVDAGVEAYYMYRHVDSMGQYCGDGYNRSLPTLIEQAVCNAGIKLENILYNVFWENGAWYYTWFRERADMDHAANGSDIYHCPNSLSTTQSGDSMAQTPSSLSSVITLAITDSAKASNSAALTAPECPATMNGKATSVSCTTAASLRAAGGGEHRMSLAAIVGSSFGGTAALLLFLILGAWCIRSRWRAGLAPSRNTDVFPELPAIIKGGPISPFLSPEPAAGPLAVSGKRALIQQNNTCYHWHAPSSLASGYGPGSYVTPSSEEVIPPNLLSPARPEIIST